jgi:DNA-binding CsgD family transcriptional regulator
MAHDVLLVYVEALIADATDDSTTAATLLGDGVLRRLSVRHQWSRDWMLAAVRIGIRADDADLVEEASTLATEYAQCNASSTRAAAWADLARGLLVDDVDLLERAVVHLEAASPRALVPQAEAHEDHGRSLLRAGRRTDAITALDNAWNVYRQIGALGPAQRVHELLRTAGAARRRFRSTAPRNSHGWAALTPAEKKVALLVANGHTNRDAAAALVLSPHTISTHLRAVFSKLDVNSRVQLARVVMELEPNLASN